MARYAMAIDLNRCVNCKACNAACKETNAVPIGHFRNWVTRKQSSRLTEENGAPSHDFYYQPMQCQHCDNPECVSVCPTGASYKREDGVVLVDHSKCIGCQYCVMACPYGVRAYDEGRDKGVIEKCTMCAHLIDKGEQPACVRHCPGQARLFGDLDDPESAPSKMRASKKTHKLTDVGNHPGVDYGLDKFTWKGGE